MCGIRGECRTQHLTHALVIAAARISAASRRLIRHHREGDHEHEQEEEEETEVETRSSEHRPKHVCIQVELRVPARGSLRCAGRRAERCARLEKIWIVSLEHLEEKSEHADRVEIERERVLESDGRPVGEIGQEDNRDLIRAHFPRWARGQKGCWNSILVTIDRMQSRLTGYKLATRAKRVETEMKKMTSTMSSTAFQMS